MTGAVLACCSMEKRVARERRVVLLLSLGIPAHKCQQCRGPLRAKFQDLQQLPYMPQSTAASGGCYLSPAGVPNCCSTAQGQLLAVAKAKPASEEGKPLASRSAGGLPLQALALGLDEARWVSTNRTSDQPSAMQGYSKAGH